MTDVIQYGNCKEYELTSCSLLSCSNTIVFSIPKKIKLDIYKYRAIHQSITEYFKYCLEFNSVYLSVLKALRNKGIPVITAYLYTNAFV